MNFFGLLFLVKLISPYIKPYTRENPFYLKLQVCTKVRLTRLELDRGKHNLRIKLRRYAKISLTHVERQPTHNKPILTFTFLLNWV